MPEPSDRPTLAAVAGLAGVTVPTASKVLNRRSDVSPRTRQRVLAAMAELGYVRQPRAHLAAPPSTGVVHLVMASLGGSWVQLALAGLEHAAHEHDLDVVVTLTKRFRDGRDWVQRVIDRPSDGAVLVLLQPTPGESARLRSAGVDWVLLDPTVEPYGAPSVGATNWLGGYAAGRHLAELGHTRIGAVAGGRSDIFSAARLDGLRSALAAHEVELPATAVRFGDWRRTVTQPVAGELLDTLAPTAVFACSDRMALGVVDAAWQRGLRIPSDLSVVGFDDLPEARWSSPPLTTIAQPVEAMGPEALRLLARLREGEQTLTGRVELPTRLVVRDSTAPPP